MTWATSEISHPQIKTSDKCVRIRVRSGYCACGTPISGGGRALNASRLHTYQRALTISPSAETAARCGLESAVPKAATRKLLGTRKISVTLIRSGSCELPNSRDSGGMSAGDVESPCDTTQRLRRPRGRFIKRKRRALKRSLEHPAVGTRFGRLKRLHSGDLVAR